MRMKKSQILTGKVPKKITKRPLEVQNSTSRKWILFVDHWFYYFEISILPSMIWSLPENKSLRLHLELWRNHY